MKKWTTCNNIGAIHEDVIQVIIYNYDELKEYTNEKNSTGICDPSIIGNGRGSRGRSI